MCIKVVIVCLTASLDGDNIPTEYYRRGNFKIIFVKKTATFLFICFVLKHIEILKKKQEEKIN